MILVAYASKHGATREIAERIAETLTAAGQESEARPVREAGNLLGCEAFVIGSAAYLGDWLKEAVDFVRRNQAILTGRPVWLFSSGPLVGRKRKAKRGRTSVPAARAAAGSSP